MKRANDLAPEKRQFIGLFYNAKYRHIDSLLADKMLFSVNIVRLFHSTSSDPRGRVPLYKAAWSTSPHQKIRYIIATDMGWRYATYNVYDTEIKRSSIWQLFRHCWYRKLSLRKLTMPPITTKLSNWRFFVLSVAILSLCCWVEFEKYAICRRCVAIIRSLIT